MVEKVMERKRVAEKDGHGKEEQEPELQKQREAKQKQLELALAQIEKQFGKGSIMTLTQERVMDVASLPTGVLTLDLALGIGGVPRGRVVEIFGPESSGKTTLTLSVIAETQRQGGIAAFIDAEHAVDPTYAKKLGVKLEELLISQPDTGEQALEIAETLVRSNAVDLVVIDSVAALVPRAELEGEMGQAQVGLQARLMSQALRKLTGAISKSKTCMIFINQLREKIGIMFGNPETTPGGRALKFYASVRLDIRRVDYIKRGDEVIGNHIRVKVVKNKVAPPFRQAEFDLYYHDGVSKAGCALDAALVAGVATKQGTWMAFGEHRLGQGRENAIQYLKENPKLLSQLEQDVRGKKGEKAG